MPQVANNIYVGARYAPLLLGAWDASVQYEPLSAVIYTDGNGYVSKRLVPAGTLPTDTDYWLLWGSGSVVIDQLSNRVGAVETRLDGLEARVTTNESNIINIQAELLAHDGRLTDLGAGLSALSDRITAIESKKGRLVYFAKYSKTASQDTGTVLGVKIPWEKLDFEVKQVSDVSIDNTSDGFKVNVPEMNGRYLLYMDVSLKWSTADTSVVAQRILQLRNGGAMIAKTSSDSRSNLIFASICFPVTEQLYINTYFTGRPGDGVQLDLPGDYNYFNLTIYDTQG